jgi:hypothetical protein
MADEAFRRGEVHTGFIQEFFDRSGHLLQADE